MLLIAGFLFPAYAQDAAEATAEVSAENTATVESQFPEINEEDLPVFADDQAAPEDDIPSGVGLGDLIRVIIVLAAVIGAIYLLLHFLRKISPMAENAEDQIQLLSTRHLRRDNSLHLVEVGNQIFLVGAGSSSVNIISEITDQETLDRLRLEKEERPAAQGNSFRSLFRRGLSLGSGAKISDQSPEFLRAQRNRLRNLEDRE